MAARLRSDYPTARVEEHAGAIGELRVAVDGRDVYAASALWYPRSRRVLEAVRERIQVR